MSFPVHWQILESLGNGTSQSFMLSSKCDPSFLYEFPILFSTVKLKLGHKFLQSIHTFKIWILKCWSWDSYTHIAHILKCVYTSKIFSIHERDGKLGFLNSLGCTSKFFQIHYRVWKFVFLKFPCPHTLLEGEDSLSVPHFV